MPPELSSYLPPLTRQGDFEPFWKETLALGEGCPLHPRRQPLAFPGVHLDVSAISFESLHGTRLQGFFAVPRFAGKGPLPCVLHLHGYRGENGPSTPFELLHWATAGFAVLSVDCRDQWGLGGNRATYDSGTGASLVARGLLDPNEYFFRGAYLDAVKALDFACQLPEVDPGRIAVEGISMGGQLALALCALDPRPRALAVDVPSGSDLAERVRISAGAFAAVTDYLKVFPDRQEKVFHTLSYFDLMNFSEKIKCPVLASVGLRDQTCPAKAFMATYNRLTCPKDLKVYPFAGHEGGRQFHLSEKMAFFQKVLAAG